MKLSAKFIRDWNFYLANKAKFNFPGVEVPIPEFDSDGISAQEAFYIFDSTGKLSPCSQPGLLKAVIVCKKAINLQIKMWVEGFLDMGEVIEYYMAEFFQPPDWVEKSFRNQLVKQLGVHRG